tara:strand:- start:237 stop:935 length:699 start_codon:yes stop_codon:yes gene_type:complete
LCAGWAPFALRYPRPKYPVTVESEKGQLTFYPHDIEALLIQLWNYSSIQSRVWIYGLQGDRGFLNSWEFHQTVLENYVYSKNGFVLDIDPSFVVKNVPVKAVQIQAKKLDGSSYEVTAKILYAPETLSVFQNEDNHLSTITYSYILEFDDELLIGSRWTSELQPDLVWNTIDSVAWSLDDKSIDDFDYTLREMAPLLKKKAETVGKYGQVLGLPIYQLYCRSLGNFPCPIQI